MGKLKPAFTLIEMLVTLIIISIITAAAVLGMKGYKGRSYFNDAVTQVYGEVSKIQSLALSPTEEDIDYFVLTFESDNSYKIDMYKTGSTSSRTIDSGKINNKVNLAVGPSGKTIKFSAKDGASVDGQITVTISDENNAFPEKTVVISPAGSVELR